MSGRATPIADQELHAYIDGELDAARVRQVEQALQEDAALAARVRDFTADKQHFASMFADLAQAPIPEAWRHRIESATAPAVAFPRPSRRRWTVAAMALAACLVLLALVSVLRTATTDTILADAAAVRRDELPARLRLSGAALLNTASRDGILQQAVGLKIRAPDLAAQHWHLVELETYLHAAALRYRSDAGQSLTLYVRRSAGTPRFDLLRNGTTRVCIWQDEVVGAVMMGDMSAGQMMRVASAAYLALNL